MADDTRIATPYFRVSFPHPFEKAKQPNGEMKYGLTMLFPNDTDFAAMKALAADAAKAKFGDIPEGLVSPFKDGNEKAKKYPSHIDMIVVEARTDYKPGIVGPDGKTEILDSETFYAGCWACCKVNAYAWENSGRKGVSFGLSNIQKVKDDESFETRYDPSDDFDSVANTAEGATESEGAAAAGKDDWLS
jgi:hypothetical protein